MKKLIAWILGVSMCFSLIIMPAPAMGDPEGYDITVVVTGDPGGGSVSPEGDAGVVPVAAGGNQNFTITPALGYGVAEVKLGGDAWEESCLYFLEYNDADGTYAFEVFDVQEALTLEVEFRKITAGNLQDTILDKGYAVEATAAISTGAAADDATPERTAGLEAIRDALIKEIGYLGYRVDDTMIAVNSDYTYAPTPASNDPSYRQPNGTFAFTVTVGPGTPEAETSSEVGGYIVATKDDVIFRFTKTDGDTPVEEIRVARAADPSPRVFWAPAMTEGTIEVFGVCNVGVEGLTSPDVRNAIDASPNRTAKNRSTFEVSQAFYRAQLHIACDYGVPDGLNWFGFNMLQDNALCVYVEPSDPANEQRTFQWELNRYAQLTTGPYTSKVFFGNDSFKISLPTAYETVTGWSVQEANSPGYTLTRNEGGPGTADDAYTIEFHSDYYDRVTLNLLLETDAGTVARQLTIERVGVHIEDYQRNPGDTTGADTVAHGTQNGSRITYTDDANYHIYATYYIPDGGAVPPYGLYVTYTWANGTTTTAIITEPCDDPDQQFAHLFNEDKVFDHWSEGNHFAGTCDYLLYQAANDANAPVKINVTILKADPRDPTTSGNFGGVYFGSGAGVEWTR